MATAPTTTSIEKEWLAFNINKGATSIFSETVKLTPTLAAALLEINDDNRPINKGRVEVYKHDMAEGRWALNGETMIVSRDGRMNDGQHRCWAVMESGVSVPAILVFGVDRESRLTTNQGKAKGAGDYAGMLGYENAKAIAAVARMVLMWKHAGAITGYNNVTHADTMAFIAQHNDQLQAAQLVSSKAYRASRLLGGQSIIGFAYYVLSEIDEVVAGAFFQSLTTGENLQNKDPILTLRNRLMSLSGEARRARAEIIFRAWNAWREGRQLSSVPILGTIPDPI